MKKNIFFAALIAIAFTAAGWLIVLAKVGQQGNINWPLMVFTSMVSLLMTWAAMLDAFNDLDDESNTALVTSTYMYIPASLWFITFLIHCPL